MNLFSYWNADKIVLRCTVRARSTSATRRSIYAHRRQLAARAGLPMPKSIDRIDQPNAFATGRDPDNAAVAATTGLLQHADAATRSPASWRTSWRM